MMAAGWTLPDFWDGWKAISVALTGLFGVMGLLTNYKDKQTGRITVWGKINLAGIVLSATMGVASQLIEAENRAVSAQRAAVSAARAANLANTTAREAEAAARSARQSAANTATLIANLLQVSRRTETIARGTERSVANSRAAAAAGQQAASRTLGVARGIAEAVAASRAGLVRVERLLSPFDDPVLSFFIPDKAGAGAAPQATCRKVRAMVQIGRMDGAGSELETIFSGEIPEHPKDSAECYYRVPLEVFSNTGVLSYLDLPGRTIELFIYLDDQPARTIADLTITTRNGENLAIPLRRAIVEQADDHVRIQYTFPENADPRSP